MTGQISKVHAPKVNDKGNTYIKVEIITKPFNEFGYTYICPENYNFGNWEEKLKHQGCFVQNLDWKNKTTRLIDADSKVEFTSKKFFKSEKQLNLF